MTNSFPCDEITWSAISGSSHVGKEIVLYSEGACYRGPIASIEVRGTGEERDRFLHSFCVRPKWMARYTKDRTWVYEPSINEIYGSVIANPTPVIRPDSTIKFRVYGIGQCEILPQQEVKLDPKEVLGLPEKFL